MKDKPLATIPDKVMPGNWIHEELEEGVLTCAVCKEVVLNVPYGIRFYHRMEAKRVIDHHLSQCSPKNLNK